MPDTERMPLRVNFFIEWEKAVKNILIIKLAMLVVFMTTDALGSDLKSPLEVVNARMMAHNAHDLKMFLDTYSEDIQVYGYPTMPFGKPGKAHIKSIFGPLFDKKSVHTEVHHQIENGRYVINHETVVRQGKTTVYVSIYEVVNGKIKSVRFINDQ